MLRKSSATASVDAFKQAVAEYVQKLLENESEELDLKFAEIIAFGVFARRNELVKVLTELVFR